MHARDAGGCTLPAMRRPLVMTAVLLLGGCECGGEAATPPPSSAPPSSVATTPTAPAAMTPEALAAALAQARAATEAHDYPTARARFDALLADPGATPAMRCEAGWVAHLAGDDAAAALLMDRALVLFDRGPHSLAHAHELAMCFYNRGQVLEAQHAPLDAREAYSNSITLRPNVTVQARLDAIPGDDTTHTVGGVAYDFDRNVLLTTHEEELQRALVSSRRTASFEGHGTATQRAALDLSGLSGTRALVYALEGGDVEGTALVLAVAVTDGYQLFTLPSQLGEHPTLSVAGAHLRVDGASSVHRPWFHDGAFRPDTVCFADSTYDETSVVICDGSPMTCNFTTLSMHPHDVAHAPVRCHAIADGALVEGAPSVTPTPLADADYDVSIDTSGELATTTTVRGTPPPGSSFGAYTPTICGDHRWCASLDGWQSDEPLATRPWVPEGLSDEEVTFVPGVTPPLAIATRSEAYREDGDVTEYDYLDYMAPYHGDWRTLVELQTLIGFETVTVGDLERVDLIPGDPLEWRFPIHWVAGETAADSVMVCAMIDDTLACRASVRPDYATPAAPIGITFDGHGHVTAPPDEGGAAVAQDLAAWIRAAPPP